MEVLLSMGPTPSSFLVKLLLGLQICVTTLCFLCAAAVGWLASTAPTGLASSVGAEYPTNPVPLSGEYREAVI